MLEVHDLTISFAGHRRAGRSTPPVVSDVSFTVTGGAIVAIIGASGAGKSLIAHALLGLLPRNACLLGKIIYKEQPLNLAHLPALRGRQIALIPQSVSYLNPLIRVGRQVQRAVRLSGCCEKTARTRTDGALARYHLPDMVRSLLPFQLSGGMARRVLTATATAGQAELLIADEPTAGLDPAAAKETLTHLREMADQGKGVLLITHDLENALQVSDTLVVLYNGTMVETTPASSLTDQDLVMHPYTRALWQSLPGNGFISLPASSGNQTATDHGCVFAERCPKANTTCRRTVPPLRKLNGKLVRCYHAAG